MDETTGTDGAPEAPVNPAEAGGHGERSGGDTSPQTGAGDISGGGDEAEEGTGDNPDVGGIGEGPGGEARSTPQPSDDVESDAGNIDAGGKAHTTSTEGHPAGDGPRSDREVGGPVAEEGAEESLGSGKGDIATKGFDAHQ